MAETSSDSSRVFTDLQLERVLCGDLDEASFESKASAADRDRLAAMRDEGASFLAEVGVHVQSVAIAAKLEGGRERRTWRLMAFAGVGLAAAAALVLVLKRGDGDSAERQVARNDRESALRDEDLQSKGEEGRLSIHLATESGSRRLLPGEQLPHAPRLRFSYAKDSAGYLAILGRDALGSVSLYVSDGKSAAAYEPERRDLPTAIELDDAPGFERFYAFFGPLPFSAAELQGELLAGASAETLAKARGLELVEVELLKARPLAEPGASE